MSFDKISHEGRVVRVAHNYSNTASKGKKYEQTVVNRSMPAVNHYATISWSLCFVFLLQEEMSFCRALYECTVLDVLISVYIYSVGFG